MVTLEAGSYFWCRCGKTPIALCMCGLSDNAPNCDGSHRDY